MTKEDEDAEQELDLMEKLEKAPISSEKIAETVKNLEKRLEKDPKSRRSTIF
ncbi:transposase [Jeotgalibacillus soli]|uniref:Transposase n=2 Tax=Jeotgalibacillus soli TaxID=889306 RepID=A0A0C2VLK4_9BACL|nr:transposase [Jeotgalibacillus soli]